MKIVVGLGNPGDEYAYTRHNVGFMTIDALARHYGVTNWKNKFDALIAEIKIDGEPILLVKPQTFMNLSGTAVGQIFRWYKASLDDVIAIYDDMDLPVGKVRLRKRGSSGGHRGVESLLVHLGKEEFPRVRIGVGRPQPGWTVNAHVLANFPKEEQPTIAETVVGLVPAIECIVKEGIDKAMNQFNLKK